LEEIPGIAIMTYGTERQTDSYRRKYQMVFNPESVAEDPCIGELQKADQVFENTADNSGE